MVNRVILRSSIESGESVGRSGTLGWLGSSPFRLAGLATSWEWKRCSRPRIAAFVTASLAEPGASRSEMEGTTKFIGLLVRPLLQNGERTDMLDARATNKGSFI